jgi:ATP-dependent DNA ligase
MNSVASPPSRHFAGKPIAIRDALERVLMGACDQAAPHGSIVSKRLSAPYRSGPSRDWLKVKNPDSPAMVRARSGVVLMAPHSGTRFQAIAIA